MLSSNKHLRRNERGLEVDGGPFDACIARGRRYIVVTGILLGLFGFAATSRAADLQGAFHGNAYATFADAVAGPVATSLGRSAFQPCPCEGTDGQTLSNTITAVSAGNNGQVLTADVTLVSVLTQKTAATAEVTDKATISKLNVLTGLITADAITAVADVSATSTTITGFSTGSTFANLKIAGHAIAANVAPNTVLALPGIGTVTLNKVRRTGNFTNAGQILVEMLTINVTTANSFGLDVGATITVAHAVAGYNRIQPTAVLGGQAYITLANDTISDNLKNRIGRAAFVAIGCQGTGGKTVTNSIDGLSVDTLISLGTGTTSAFGGPQSGAMVARTTATVENVSLLGGLVGAATISAVAQESLKQGALTTSTAGSGFVGLTVLGLPVPITLSPNTGIALPGIGKVVINEQTTLPTGAVQVNGLHIFVTTLNLLGLPVGTEIIVAHADARAAPF